MLFHLANLIEKQRGEEEARPAFCCNSTNSLCSLRLLKLMCDDVNLAHSVFGLSRFLNFLYPAAGAVWVV